MGLAFRHGLPARKKAYPFRVALCLSKGLFYATLRGPGTVWIQTLPVSRLASRILQYGTVKRKDEGSILGGLGNMIDGDGW